MLPVMRCKAGDSSRSTSTRALTGVAAVSALRFAQSQGQPPPLELFLLLRCFFLSFLGFFGHDELLGLWLGKQGRLSPCGTARGADAKAIDRL